MRFLSIYKTVERNTPPSPEEMAAMGKLIEEGMKAGWLLSTEGCLPTALGARVRRSDANVTVTDGPFAEAKEVVGGFAILSANSRKKRSNWYASFFVLPERASANSASFMRPIPPREDAPAAATP
jgi:hypothetical protein